MAAISCSKQETAGPASPSPQPAAPVSSAAAAAAMSACEMLTKEEVQAVQGEAFKDTKASQKTVSGQITSQCYFELPTTVNSIVLTVTLKGQGGRDPSESWREIFHSEKPREKEKEGEEEAKKPLKVEGVGDEAFWTGTKVGGALYVLKGNAYLRISLGGPDDQATKIAKSKALAEKIVPRL